jgi:hypothetical protein
MIRIKNLPLSLISTLLVGFAINAQAQLALDVSSQKSYRQNEKGVQFQGGKFNINFSDGALSSIGGCNFISYYPPRDATYFCGIGTSGYLESGVVDGVTPPDRYLAVTSIASASIVEPGESKLVRLNAAPASTLKRPKAGFNDSSSVISYNLHTSFVEKFTIARYRASTTYTRKQGKKFESDIVPGTYQYYFPRLGQPTVPVAILPVIYPMPEASAKGAAKRVGLRFTSVNQNKWSKDGFMELSYSKPNLFKWTPFDAQSLFLNADALSFAIRVIKDPEKANSPVVEQDGFTSRTQSVFPDFSTNTDPKIFLRNPTTSTFTTPPLLAGGTKGIVELELKRSLKTGGITYDSSSRKFQLPVVVVNKYSDYRDLAFPNKNANTGLLDDADGDGYNNLNEWILDSEANNPEIQPVAPVAKFNPTLYDFDVFGFYYSSSVRIVRSPYYGFTVAQKLGTDPAIVYTLQRSKDGSKTWQDFPDGYYYNDGTYSVTPISNPFLYDNIAWVVQTTDYKAGVGAVKANAPARREIQVRTSYSFLGPGGPNAAPPGTENDKYRVKISLKR